MWQKREGEWERERAARARLMHEVSRVLYSLLIIMHSFSEDQGKVYFIQHYVIQFVSDL